MNISFPKKTTKRYFGWTVRIAIAVLVVFLSFGSAIQPRPASATDGIWSDEFDVLNPETWDWLGAEPSIFEIGGASFLRMTASQDPLGVRNMLLRSVATGDFTIITRVLFTPNTNFQFAGLVIYQDDGNFLQFGRAYCDVEGACVGDGIYFDAILGGEMAVGNFATAVNPGDVYLRLERRGNMIRAFYSLDQGTSWYIVGDHWVPSEFQVNGVGLTASQDYSAIGIAADFDFFQLSEGFGFLPEGYHDYDQGDVPSWACNAGGWAADPDDRSAYVPVEIVVDDQPFASVLADQFRPDLLEAGVCKEGNCGFSASMWGAIASYEPHTIATWAQDSTGQWVLLYNSNKPINCRTYDIYDFDTVTKETRQITDLRETDEYNPSWSPNGKKVAHDVVYGDGSYEVYITDVTTGLSVPLAGAGPGSNDAVWSPNGKWIAFDDETATISMVPAAGGSRTLLRENAVSMDWTPNGKRIVFQDMTDGSLRTTPVSGSKGSETIIVPYGENPSWSPDGNWIAYQINGEIWKIAVNIQGAVLGEPIPVTHLIPGAGQPTWSTDSLNIIFHSGQTRDYDLWTIPADGGNPTWLTGAPGFGDYDPENAWESSRVAYASFSPDGQAARQWALAFTSDLPAGFWTPGTHTYRYEWEWSVPEPGSLIPEYTRTFESTYNAPRFDGYVLMRRDRLHGYFTEDGLVCDPIDAINPDQATRLLGGWVTDVPMTYAEAGAHFASMTARTVIDDSIAVDLAPHEIQSWSALDWGQYVCTNSLGPPKMDLRINYGNDWVESFYEAGHNVMITVTDGDGNVKATASAVTEPKDFWGGAPGFTSLDSSWDPEPPDIVVGDWVSAVVDNGATATIQLGDIQGTVDSEADRITGNIFDPSITVPVSVECPDWGSGGDPINKIAGMILSDGNELYSCEWNPETEWDVLPGQDIGASYFTPGGHWVANAFRDERPKMDLRVNYGNDWVESFYEAGHNAMITVTDGDGNVKATASAVTEPKDFWGGAPGFTTLDSSWDPEPPDIVVGDWVSAVVDNGITAKVQIGDINGVVDAANDSITGTIMVPWLSKPVPVECLDWGYSGEPINKDAGLIAVDGSQSYFCSWDPVTEWDVQPWQDIGVGYFTPLGHWVANAFHAE